MFHEQKNANKKKKTMVKSQSRREAKGSLKAPYIVQRLTRKCEALAKQKMMSKEAPMRVCIQEGVRTWAVLAC